jgi:hypothetical protein
LTKTRGETELSKFIERRDSERQAEEAKNGKRQASWDAIVKGTRQREADRREENRQQWIAYWDAQANFGYALAARALREKRRFEMLGDQKA